MLNFRKKPASPTGVPAGDTSSTTAASVPTRSAADEVSWFERLRTGLRKTGSNITSVFAGTKVDEAVFEDLESALLVADTGIEATAYLMNALRARAKRERIETQEQLKSALAELLVELLVPLEKRFDLEREAPIVTMIAGVNGAGKTTSIGKLARYFQAHGKTVLLAAADTFRAAAREQLVVWGQRNGVHVVAQEGGDPAAIVFDAIASARARQFGVMMADTAGRLPTQQHLMEELKKIKRVIAKALAGAPHEILLVIDGNTGQNAVAQVKAFDDAVSLTGLIITKLDGTAKGGVLAAIARQRPIPVYFIGMGEGLDDLQPFVASEFVAALLS
jgi:fused signal recognition particle receptor